MTTSSHKDFFNLLTFFSIFQISNAISIFFLISIQVHDPIFQLPFEDSFPFQLFFFSSTIFIFSCEALEYLCL